MLLAHFTTFAWDFFDFYIVLLSNYRIHFFCPLNHPKIEIFKFYFSNVNGLIICMLSYMSQNSMKKFLWDSFVLFWFFFKDF